MMTLPILHAGSDQSPPESSFLLMITNTASFCEKNSVSSRKQDYIDPLWLNVAVWKMQIWSPERKERVMWSHFQALADLLGTNTLLNRRGQGDKLSPDSLNTRHCWVCSPAITKARPGIVQHLLQRREHSWKAARTCLQEFCSSWPDQSLHTIQRTLTPQTPNYHHISRFSNATPMGFLDTTLTLWNGKEIHIHYGGRNHTQCGHKPVHFISL